MVSNLLFLLAASLGLSSANISQKQTTSPKITRFKIDQLFRRGGQACFVFALQWF